MAKNNSEDDDFDGDDEDDEMFDDFDIAENKQVSFKDSSDARRRLENLKEEKALERLLSGDLNDWDDSW